MGYAPLPIALVFFIAIYPLVVLLRLFGRGTWLVARETSKLVGAAAANERTHSVPGDIIEGLRRVDQAAMPLLKVLGVIFGVLLVIGAISTVVGALSH